MTVKAMEMRCKELKANMDYAFNQLIEAKTADAETWMLANDNYIKASREWMDATSELLDRV